MQTIRGSAHAAQAVGRGLAHGIAAQVPSWERRVAMRWLRRQLLLADQRAEMSIRISRPMGRVLFELLEQALRERAGAA